MIIIMVPITIAPSFFGFTLLIPYGVYYCRMVDSFIRCMFYEYKKQMIFTVLSWFRKIKLRREIVKKVGAVGGI